MRGLCISFTSSCFLFPIGGKSKKLDDLGGRGEGDCGVKKC